MSGLEGTISFTPQSYHGEQTITIIDWIESFANTLVNDLSPLLDDFSVEILRGPGTSIGRITPELYVTQNSEYYSEMFNYANTTGVSEDNDWATDDGVKAIISQAAYPDVTRRPTNIYNHTRWDVEKTEQGIINDQFNLGYDFESYRCDIILKFILGNSKCCLRIKYPIATTGFYYDGVPVENDSGGFIKDRTYFSSARASCMCYYPSLIPANSFSGGLNYLNSINLSSYVSKKIYTYDDTKFYRMRQDRPIFFLKPMNQDFDKIMRIQCSAGQGTLGVATETSTVYDNHNIKLGLTGYSYPFVTSKITIEGDSICKVIDEDAAELGFSVDTVFNNFIALVTNTNSSQVIKYLQSYDKKTVMLVLKVNEHTFFKMLMFELSNGNLGLIINDYFLEYHNITNNIDIVDESWNKIITTSNVTTEDNWILENYEVSVKNKNSYALSLYKVITKGNNKIGNKIIGKLNNKRVVFQTFSYSYGECDLTLAIPIEQLD